MAGNVGRSGYECVFLPTDGEFGFRYYRRNVLEWERGYGYPRGVRSYRHSTRCNAARLYAIGQRTRVAEMVEDCDCCNFCGCNRNCRLAVLETVLCSNRTRYCVVGNGTV